MNPDPPSTAVRRFLMVCPCCARPGGAPSLFYSAAPSSGEALDWLYAGQPTEPVRSAAQNQAGGITSVTLKAEGGAFVVAVATRSGDDGVLVTTHSEEPRRFTDLRKALLLLREMGIASVQVDATRWNPDE